MCAAKLQLADRVQADPNIHVFGHLVKNVLALLRNGQDAILLWILRSFRKSWLQI